MLQPGALTYISDPSRVGMRESRGLQPSLVAHEMQPVGRVVTICGKKSENKHRELKTTLLAVTGILLANSGKNISKWK